MTQRGQAPRINPCSTCPWLRSNFRKRHASGWYTLRNLRRLWNGLRSGKAPGMVCHATDPESQFYGSEKLVMPGTKLLECIGATLLIQRELVELGKAKDFRAYRRSRPFGLTIPGAGMWMERALFGHVPVAAPTSDVCLPGPITKSKSGRGPNNKECSENGNSSREEGRDLEG
jgi:hypothetical protein